MALEGQVCQAETTVTDTGILYAFCMEPSSLRYPLLTQSSNVRLLVNQLFKKKDWACLAICFRLYIAILRDVGVMSQMALSMATISRLKQFITAVTLLSSPTALVLNMQTAARMQSPHRERTCNAKRCVDVSEDAVLGPKTQDLSVFTFTRSSFTSSCFLQGYKISQVRSVFISFRLDLL